jgi:carboxypeptidase family protein
MKTRSDRIGWTLRALAAGWLAATVTCALAADDPAPKNPSPAPGAAAAAAPDAAKDVAPARPPARPGEDGRLRGEVSFNRQSPVVGADVVGVHDGDPGRLLLGVTDMNGYFRFESIPSGSWTLGVAREGVAPVTKPGVLVQPPARCVVDLQMRAAEGRAEPPRVDLARFETSAAAARAGEGMIVEVMDTEMRPIIDARVSLRSRGPRVDPIRGAADIQGIARLAAPEPGEYAFKVEVPGFLPAHIEHLVLGRTAPIVTVVLTPRPLDYPARPAELLPEEKSIPPEGFPGSPESPPPAAGDATAPRPIPSPSAPSKP